ncbi:MAG TPA: acylphosphatase [Candidatus Ratteibacteria bacterium]|jgi:acylphosphatase|uniref:acylphosphatase n=1 Tax=candidate division TA06 bacterium ADurb.Bin131 TaxID=1852827 RepID=A0A1V6CDU5_UNCT6|nr:MAG: Acylphosphatase [candidate division TA06 bacterium ADurb.Bin131]HON05646.1 acylphosphatase [bacterium]HOQ82324.1 acylphosphatase [bacterium]HRS06690.1 acylphosphatase [Candidatus Ratteibacteria bacterium]HRV04811.1 acylphosphatase [Candidatus Ratteibacteria bacterium]
MEKWHYLIKGKVQGVGFRWYVLNIARRIGISGWVKNLPDGRVEIVAESEPEQLELFTENIKKGHLGQNIYQINIEKAPATGKFKDFNISFS